MLALEYKYVLTKYMGPHTEGTRVALKALA